ncbi:GIY-YIG nuclease family protein [Vibrio rumoiensis]|uniref:GIY-YIG nuclease family protein n=1 Tax=Vibrio rumoiensis TaxID=76258 RepID=UPI000B5CF88D|nr:GIY-YIG nuclease family protein [Vibrio rumoiensis]
MTEPAIQKREQLDKDWHVYLIRTRANTLYCGITNDLQRRFEQHQSGKGAKYLRGKGPLLLVWSQQVADKSSALKEEIRIKKLSKSSKEKLVIGP